MKQPSTKEKTRILLTGIWRNHQSRFMDLVGELEELAVGLLLEMPGNKFVPQRKNLLSVTQLELLSLRKDPRINCRRLNAISVYFDDLPLEVREQLVGEMVEALKEDKR